MEKHLVVYGANEVSIPVKPYRDMREYYGLVLLTLFKTAASTDSMVNTREVDVKLLYLLLLFSTGVFVSLNFYTTCVQMAREEEGPHSVD